jgi:hypothetical protein
MSSLPFGFFFSQYAMPVTLDRLAILERNVKIQNCLYSGVSQDCDEVHKCAESELSRIHFGFIPASKSGELVDWKSLWTASITAFPSCEKDALMASRCYALECHDAAVYHSMMVLERGILALAKKLNVKKANARAWQTELLPVLKTPS